MSDEAPIQPEYLSPKQAAIYLSVTPKVLEHWRRRGVGPRHHRVGKRIRYSRRVLDAYMAEREVQNTCEEVPGL